MYERERGILSAWTVCMYIFNDLTAEIGMIYMRWKLAFLFSRQSIVEEMMMMTKEQKMNISVLNTPQSTTNNQTTQFSHLSLVPSLSHSRVGKGTKKGEQQRKGSAFKMKLIMIFVMTRLFGWSSAGEYITHMCVGWNQFRYGFFSYTAEKDSKKKKRFTQLKLLRRSTTSIISHIS